MSTAKETLKAIEARMEALTKQMNSIIQEKDAYLLSLQDRVIISSIKDQSCTCHDCVSGRQTCGYDVKMVGCWKENPVELPTKVESSSQELTFYNKEGGKVKETKEWAWGESVRAVVWSLLDQEE